MNAHELEVALKRDAARLEHRAPDGLDQGIIRAVAESARPKRRSSLAGPLFLSFAAAAGVAIAVFVYQRPGPISPKASAVPASASDSPTQTALPLAADLLRQDPLQHEADSVYADARSAVNFLALNFLPTSPSKG